MNLNNKTQVLIEALPYIKKYHGKIVVIKFGGNAMSEIKHVIEDIVLLKHIGIKPVVVHGGGPEIDKELKKAKIETKFINGLRYTDNKTIIIVKQKNPKLGLVGEITKINDNKILKIINNGFIPVISPLGIGKGSKHYNINADTAASHTATALNAEKLTILTNVDGVIINKKLQTHIDFNTAKKEIKKGIISKGMIPKVEACIYAVKNKCPKAHLINGLVPHSLLLEIFTDKGIGTEIVYKNNNQ